MAGHAITSPIPPVDRTLTRVVVLMRLLGWAWLVVLSLVVLFGDRPDVSGIYFLVNVLIGTAGAGLTVLAAGRGFLGKLWYLLLDAAIALGLALAGLVSGLDEFVVGGYPVSWLFIVAYATNLTWSVVSGVIASIVFAILHRLMDLGLTRLFGSIQFLIVAVVVGWAFDALRRREALRVEAEEARDAAEESLAEERAAKARLEERSSIARRLHDSVLQTLNLISASAEDAAEVRYLSRVQQRDLRRTISEYESPYTDSFRARLLDVRAEMEDRYRVEIDPVINCDLEMDDTLRAVIAATTEALNNAARHSGSSNIDLFAEVHDDLVTVSVRDRGRGFDPDDTGNRAAERLGARVEGVGGRVTFDTAPGAGTSVLIEVPVG